MILICEDHLFVIEVKGGAFTYTSPANDFSAYLASIRNLVLKPAEQGRRFLEYLESEECVPIFDSDHKKVGEVSRAACAHKVVCVVTLDPFTELAAQVQHLSAIGIEVGSTPTWPISIDDLRVYSDIFENHLVFLHFVEQRMRAFGSDLIKTDDELDHIGLYLKHNVYAEYAKKVNPREPIIWHGYRSGIDRFFADKLHDPNAVCPLRQDIPARLKELVDFLAATDVPRRRKISSTLLNCGGTWRDNIAAGIDGALNKQRETRRPRPLSMYGSANITLFCWQAGVLERDAILAREHATKAMLLAHESQRLLLEIAFDTSGKLVGVDPTFIEKASLTGAELACLAPMVEELRAKRVAEAMKEGPIGRNAQCPCGSGKKYKICCSRH